MSKILREFTDPTIYNDHHARFEQEGLPRSQSEWIGRTREVAEILALDAPKRDIENKSPRAEIALLKSAGLTKVLGPTKYGGGGENWETGYKLIREVAKADGSIGMLLGYHLLWSTTANVVGTDEQQDSIQEAINTHNYFIGGAVNPRDSDLKITSQGEELVFNGFKNFNTGGVISDLTVLEGVLDGTQDHIFTFVKTDQPGIQFSHNWDNIGLRLTESGSVKIDNVRVPWSDALGWDPAIKKPIQDVLGIPLASMLLPTIQLVFSNFYLGIAQGALDAAAKYTVNGTRAWPYGGDNKEKATEEWYILERYGAFRAHLNAADALADRAGAAIAGVYADAGQHGSSIISSGSGGRTANGVSNGHYQNGSGGSPTDLRKGITAQRRGEVAVLVASVKVVTTDTGLSVTSGIFEMLGARATGRKYGFDRFWRDVRTHSLHDPVAYKKREVGVWHVLREAPEPTWYT
jgi:alkylation response protein AidB-like acyl-CoA dehydrogenase